MRELFEPLSAGKLELSNRLVMAPMTRSRATGDGTVTELTAEYYRSAPAPG